MKYSVPFIYDTITNNFIDSETLLSEFNNSPERKSDERTRIMKAIKASKPLYLCGACQQPVIFVEDVMKESINVVILFAIFILSIFL